MPTIQESPYVGEQVSVIQENQHVSNSVSGGEMKFIHLCLRTTGEDWKRVRETQDRNHQGKISFMALDC